MKESCPDCRSTKIIGNGYNVTKKGRFARGKCQKCGRTFYLKKGGK